MSRLERAAGAAPLLSSSHRISWAATQVLELAPCVGRFNGSLGATGDHNTHTHTNEIEHEEETVTKLEERILAHCFLLPYVLPNKIFNKMSTVVYNDWDVGCLRVPKKEISLCNRVLRI